MIQFLVCNLILGLASVWAQPVVYSLTFNPSTLSSANLPATTTATVSIATENEDPFYVDVYLNTSDFSSSAWSGWNTNIAPTTVVCPASQSGKVCRQYLVEIEFDASNTNDIYLPSVDIGFFRNSGQSVDFVFYNSAQLEAGGITSRLVLQAGSTSPVTCSIAPVAGGSPIPDISDTTPPELVNGTACVTPAEVDVRNSSQTIQISFRIRDNLSGFSNGWLYLNAPNTGQYSMIDLSQGNRVSGNQWDGTYVVTATIPQGASAGTWTLGFFLRDVVNNSNSVNPGGSGGNGPGGFEVISNPDTVPPTIQSITFSPSTVDVSTGPQTVTLEIRITDAASGLNLTGSSSGIGVRPVMAPANYTQWRTILTSTSLSSGTVNDGVYRLPITIPQYSQSGTWRVGIVQLKDNAGNELFASNNFNSGALPSATLQVLSSSPVDIIAPQVSSLTISPAFVNVTNSSQTVTVTATVTDSLAGVEEQFGCYVFLGSASGGQSQFAWLSRTSGTPQSGLYRGNVTLPQFSEIGTWRPSSLLCRDQANNQLSISGQTEFLARFPNAKVDVTQPSSSVDGNLNTSSSSTTVSDAGSTVEITFPPGSVAAPTTVAIDVLPLAPNIPVPSGLSLGTGFVSVELTPKPSGPFPAPGVTIELPLTTQLEPGTTLMLYRVDPATGRLTRAPRVSPPGGFVTGVVGVSGLSATFTGVSGFSTVVGLVPEGRPGDINSDGQVDCEDARIIRSSWNLRQGQFGFDQRADANNDRVVNLFDLALVSRNLPRGARCQ